jgi:PAS domain S-box-containing protein
MAEAMSGVGHWRLDLGSQRVTWSREVYAIHGVTPETFDPNLDEAVGFYVKEDQPRVQAFLAQVASSVEELGFELRLRRSDGDTRNVACRAHCERDASGAPVAIFGVFQDVTAHKRALEVVQRSKRLYQLLADHSTDLISRSNLASDILYLSPAIETLTGYQAEDLIGRKTYDLIHPDDWPLVQREYAKLVHFGAKAKIAPVTYRLRRKDGSYVWVEAASKLVWVDDGLAEFVDVLRDITVRRAAQDALVVARKAAESAGEAKAQFLANMSHELRTPLTSIIGFSRLLGEQANLPPIAVRCVEKVDAASRALLCTVNDILDYSRLEAGKITINPKPTDVRSFVRATMDLMAPMAGAKALILQREVAEAVPAGLTFDPDRLRQVLLNLLGNAVKFTAAGTIGLQVALNTERSEMTVSVTDTGPGIDPDKLELLFNRFSQVDEGIARSHGGAGLGLAICKGLVEAMGGSVGVTSAPGVGSRFWCTIPTQVALLPQAIDASQASLSDVSGLRVLVVDDNPANLELSHAMLDAAGCEATGARDGLEALRLAAEMPFDVILMDVLMPGFDGIRTLEALRGGAGPNDATPVLAFTANADGSAADLLSAGFDGVVGKPVQSSALLQSLLDVTHVVEYRNAS